MFDEPEKEKMEYKGVVMGGGGCGGGGGIKWNRGGGSNKR